MVEVVLEIEFDLADEQEAQKLTEGFAMYVLSHPSVVAVAAGLKSDYAAHALPITERYLENE